MQTAQPVLCLIKPHRESLQYGCESILQDDLSRQQVIGHFSPQLVLTGFFFLGVIKENGSNQRLFPGRKRRKL